jgi:hypothetical protein
MRRLIELPKQSYIFQTISVKPAPLKSTGMEGAGTVRHFLTNGEMDPVFLFRESMFYLS